MEQVILVNEHDEITGVMEKMEAHKKALLHRAFSVFVFNDKNELLMQRRATDKYHSGGLWTNTCCSHPRPGEDVLAAAMRRLYEELGFTTTLSKAFQFKYRADFENGIAEHELDHVLTGYYNGKVFPNPKEVSEIAWWSPQTLATQMEEQPETFTAWFNIAYPKLQQWRDQK